MGIVDGGSSSVAVSYSVSVSEAVDSVSVTVSVGDEVDALLIQ